MDLDALEAKALELTRANVVKGRTSKTGSYLHKFIDTLNGRDETNAKNRVEIIATISVGICQEQFAAEGGLDLENPEHVDYFGITNKKVKAQVAAAISNSQNNTSLSYNPTTKDKYVLCTAESGKGRIYWIEETE